jgi:hypothetical protein
VITRRDLLMVAIAAFLFGGTAGIVGGMIGARMLMRFGMYMAGPMRTPGGPYWDRRHPGPPGGPPGPPPVLRRLERVLDLSPAQRESIGVVLERSRGRFEAMRDSLDAQIEAQLTPTQRTQWRMLREQGPPEHENWPHRP